MEKGKRKEVKWSLRHDDDDGADEDAHDDDDDSIGVGMIA